MQALEHLTDEHRERIATRQYEASFRTWLRTGSSEGLVTGGAWSEKRAMGTNVPTGGGFLAPESFSRELWRRLTGASSMRTASSILEAFGTGIAIAYLDDSSNKGRIQPENQAGTETDYVLALRRLPLFAFDSDILRVSMQTLQDAGIEAVEAKLIEGLSLRVAANLNQHATIGAGAGEPQGLFTAVTVGVSGATGQTTSVTYDDLSDLIGQLSDIYAFGRDGIGAPARWMMNGSTLGFIRKLKDGEGAPIWRPDPRGNTAGSLLGFRITINPDAPTLAASAKPIVFGLLSSFGIADGPVTVQRLSERYAEYGQVAFRIVARHAAGMIDPAGVRAYQNSAT